MAYPFKPPAPALWSQKREFMPGQNKIGEKDPTALASGQQYLTETFAVMSQLNIKHLLFAYQNVH